MKPTIEQLEPQPIVGIRLPVVQSEIGNRIGELMPELMQHAGDRFTGVVLARWHSWEGDRGDMELAVTVREPMQKSGRIEPAELPACRAAVFLHVGSYDGLAAAWIASKEWLETEGCARSEEAPWEAYLSDCSVVPEAELQTQIVWPLAEETDPHQRHRGGPTGIASEPSTPP